MALSITYAEIRRELGRFLAIGEDPTAWSTDDSTRVSDVITRGSRVFYFPPPGMIDDKRLIGHDWTFIRDALSVTLAADTTYNDLPTDFVRMIGRPSIAGAKYPLEEVTEDQLRNLENAGEGSGEPQYFHIQRETPSSATLLYQIGVHPQPTTATTLAGLYLFDPIAPSAVQAPIVPSNHAETMMAAFIMVADEVLNPESSEGKYEAKFKEMLAASIIADQTLGGS